MTEPNEIRFAREIFDDDKPLSVREAQGIKRMFMRIGVVWTFAWVLSIFAPADVAVWLLLVIALALSVLWSFALWLMNVLRDERDARKREFAVEDCDCEPPP